MFHFMSGLLCISQIAPRLTGMMLRQLNVDILYPPFWGWIVDRQLFAEFPFAGVDDRDMTGYCVWPREAFRLIYYGAETAFWPDRRLVMVLIRSFKNCWFRNYGFMGRAARKSRLYWIWNAIYPEEEHLPKFTVWLHCCCCVGKHPRETRCPECQLSGLCRDYQ